MTWSPYEKEVSIRIQETRRNYLEECMESIVSKWFREACPESLTCPEETRSQNEIRHDMP